ncbi:hypothetical protein F441_02033 [Phytophthora nicotianae CJ01A1]|uniref:Uncharacterized protein n=2 Tax=Phytophthora nicotianae TaxID=4792 RepID=W2HF88_PHYNI|nr:hypothetical protein L915_03598 [Phytophthora nicotianae]ETL46588.1 hypothetical protein L916_03543 [Phytophthora nicotianae]ETP25080.1 hypothetical protein F441_02033 [Phytophthora nicotianae CJ01A1]
MEKQREERCSLDYYPFREENKRRQSEAFDDQKGKAN